MKYGFPSISARDTGSVASRRPITRVNSLVGNISRDLLGLAAMGFEA